MLQLFKRLFRRSKPKAPEVVWPRGSRGQVVSPSISSSSAGPASAHVDSHGYGSPLYFAALMDTPSDTHRHHHCSSSSGASSSSGSDWSSSSSSCDSSSSSSSSSSSDSY